MPEPDEERDRRFKADVENGLSITQLAEKYRIGRRQVSRLKKKLRKREPSPRVTSPLTQTSTSANLRRVTFWINREMIDRIKALASEQGKTASALVRDIFTNYLKKHRH